MKRLVIAAATAAALLVPGSAVTAVSTAPASRAHRITHATRRPTVAMLAEVKSRNPVTTALAEEYWRATPCGGQINQPTPLPGPEL
jgi:hypothetical protein